MIPSPTRGDGTEGRTRKDSSHTTYDSTDNIEIADRVRSSASKLPSVVANYHLDHADGFPPKYETMMDGRGAAGRTTKRITRGRGVSVTDQAPDRNLCDDERQITM